MKDKNIFFNRELSWIEFNARVLAEACNKELPLFERINFLSIVSSNFDEFFMVRVADLKRQLKIDPQKKDISNLTVKEQLEKISQRVHELYKIQYDCLNKEILPDLEKNNLIYVPEKDYTIDDSIFTEKYFKENVFPLLTPLRAGENFPFPHITNLKLNVAFILSPLVETTAIPSEFRASENEKPLAIVQIPSGISRILWLPSDNEERRFTLLDDLIVKFGTQLFSGYEVEESCLFRVTCDAAFAVDEDRDEDFIQAMEEILVARQSAVPIRMACNKSSAVIKNMLINRLQLEDSDIYEVDGILDTSVLSTIEETISNPDFENLKYPKWKHYIPKEFNTEEPIWDQIKKQDLMLHTPYESFDPVVNMINLASQDPDVLAIKITLYRTSGNSPIVKALELAARNGKQVTVFIELKARFDEKRNIEWANKLQNAGVIVVYGIVNLKVHSKMLLVVRKEGTGVNRYVQVSTGNYNEKTAKLYSDISLFTCNEEIANDATLFFNMISGYSVIQTMQKIKMSPINLKNTLLSLIEREIQASSPERPGLIMAKMNSLAHPDIIKALYKASCNNVKVKLNVRGICMLVPGIKDLSENIQVKSIIDRYLEHARICYFQNGGNEELYISSADWMPRNLDRRVEILFPVLDERLFRRIKSILTTYMEDNTNASVLSKNGKWIKLQPAKGTKTVRAQKVFHDKAQKHFESDNKNMPKEFIVRRK